MSLGEREERVSEIRGEGGGRLGEREEGGGRLGEREEGD